MILKHWRDNFDIEIKDGKQLKKILKVCNPSMLKNYKQQIHAQRDDIKIEGCGSGIKIIKIKKEENVQ